MVFPGIDLKKFSSHFTKKEAKNLLKLPDDKLIVTYFGSLTQEKGTGDLIQAADLLPPEIKRQLFIIIWAIWKGSNQHKKIVNLIKNLNPSNFKMEEGYVDIPTALAASDLVVFPQQTGHGATIPQISIIETLSANKKVVATNILGNRDIFINPQESLAIPKSPESLAQKMVENLNRNKLQLKIDLEEFDLSQVVNKYISIYKQVSK